MKNINIFWIRHAISCSNIASGYAIKLNNYYSNYKEFKRNNINLNTYAKDSDITNIGINKITEIIPILENIHFDFIITSNLIRAIKTGDEIAKNLNISDINIIPFIQENNTFLDNYSARSINNLLSYLNYYNFNSNIYIFKNYKLFLEKSNLHNFLLLLNSILKCTTKINYNIIVITHGGFLEKYITGYKVSNLEIFKQEYKFYNNYYIKYKPIKYTKNKKKNNQKYYLSNLNISTKQFKDSINQCNISLL